MSRLFEHFDDKNVEYAPRITRLVNLLIDSLVNLLVGTILYFLFYSLLVLSGVDIVDMIRGGGLGFWLFAIPYISFYLFPYYIFPEWAFNGKTLGKLITKTRVVRMNGKPLGFGIFLLRTCCRLIPFDCFSFFFLARGWHDQLSNTSVVKDV
ncbi:RDD family protein [Chitinophagales bacterium]|nr:RDD family protein [Chitinophagales bacterium]